MSHRIGIPDRTGALMELELSRGTAYTFAAIILTGGLTLFGWRVTPLDGDREPLLLSPAYVSTMRHLRLAQGWLRALERLDADMKNVLAGDGNLYAQGRDAERAFAAAAAVVRSAQQTHAPPSLAALQTAVDQCADSYLRAARSLLIYVSAPTEENQVAAERTLETARDGLDALGVSQERLWPQP